MSLLMDALKRAEKAREAQAEKATRPGDSPFSAELSLDPMEDLESTSMRQAPASASERAGTGTELMKRSPTMAKTMWITILTGRRTSLMRVPPRVPCRTQLWVLEQLIAGDGCTSMRFP